jgi:ArsR family transcriptional regulator, arsenate/arsenite/antimonite-responsive transcriptional repressor
MKESQALLAMAALSQETRLRIVRRLVRAGPKGVAAGVLAEGLGISPSNMSFHLKELDRSELIEARREARSIFYFANYETLNGLIRFLMEDCCNGRPEICTPALAECCAPAVKSSKRERAYA